MLDARVEFLLMGLSTGKALRDTGMLFSSKMTHSLNFNRRDGTLFSQFLSNHFPSFAYFSRFNLPIQGSLCKCDTILDDRDHLSFDCPDYESTRNEVREALSTSNISWEQLLSNVSCILKFAEASHLNWSPLSDHSWCISDSLCIPHVADMRCKSHGVIPNLIIIALLHTSRLSVAVRRVPSRPRPRANDWGHVSITECQASFIAYAAA